MPVLGFGGMPPPQQVSSRVTVGSVPFMLTCSVFVGFLFSPSFFQFFDDVAGFKKGWGMAVTAQPTGGVEVTTVKRGSPADVAGILVGDFIVQIDRADAADKPDTQVVGMLKGAGKKCVIAVRRSLTTVIVPKNSGTLGLTVRSDFDIDRLVVDTVAKKSVCGSSGMVSAGALLWAIDGVVLGPDDHQVLLDHVRAGNQAGRPIILDFMPMLQRNAGK